MSPSITASTNLVINLRGNLREEAYLAVIFTSEMLRAVRRRCCHVALVLSAELSSSSMVAGPLRCSVLDG